MNTTATTTDTVNLLALDLASLIEWCEQVGEKRFRAIQLFRWIHQHGVADFSQMTDLAHSLRSKLAERACVAPLTLKHEHISQDNTVKWLFDIGNGNAIETVYIPETDRGTLCISSQAGCAVGCRFCSTGHQGFSRNLTTGEIVAQLWYAEHTLRRYFNTKNRVISNVVLMGMGEPLQNYDALLPALRIMLEQHGYGISRRRLTVSTSGVVPAIDRLAKDCPVALAVSLHAGENTLRDYLVPLNRTWPLEELMQACIRYLTPAPRDTITFEYCMIAGINDQSSHANTLINLFAKYAKKGLSGKINLIPFNPFPGSGLHKSDHKCITAFAKELQKARLITTIRKTRGDDINAACGQLAGDVRDRTKRKKRIGHQRMQDEHIFARLLPPSHSKRAPAASGTTK